MPRGVPHAQVRVLAVDGWHVWTSRQVVETSEGQLSDFGSCPSAGQTVVESSARIFASPGGESGLRDIDRERSGARSVERQPDTAVATDPLHE